MPRIAFIGLGAMGLPMAANIAKAGFAVAGYDIDHARAAALAEAGGEAAPEKKGGDSAMASGETVSSPASKSSGTPRRRQSGCS